eukprot:66316-Heterocapsa_arctica.AAC.1
MLANRWLPGSPGPAHRRVSSHLPPTRRSRFSWPGRTLGALAPRWYQGSRPPLQPFAGYQAVAYRSTWTNR